MRWKKAKMLVMVMIFLVLTLPINSQVIEDVIVDDVLSYDVEMPDGKSVIYRSKEDQSKELKIYTEQEEYRCLQKCKIPVCIENRKLLDKADLIIPDSVESIELKEEITRDEKSKNIDTKVDNFTTCYEFQYEVAPNTPSTKIDFKFNIDGEDFILDPTVVSGCTETASTIECTGTLTGDILNNSNPARKIYIYDATITSNDKFLNITSSGKIIFNGTNTFNAFGATGSNGAGDSGSCSSGSVNGGNGNAGTSGRILVYSDAEIILNGTSTWNGYGGNGGEGGDASCSLGSGDANANVNGGTGASGGNGQVNITTQNLTVVGTHTINGYSGNGGAGGDASMSCPRSGCRGDSIAGNAGASGTFIVSIDARNIRNVAVNSLIVNAYSGAGGTGGQANGCGDTDNLIAGNGGNSGSGLFFMGGSTLFNDSNAAYNYYAGSAGTKGSNDGDGCSIGAGSNGAQGTLTSRYETFGNMFLRNLSTHSSASGTIINFAQSTIGRLYITGSSIPSTHTVNCASVFNKLLYFLNNTASVSLAFSSCTSYQATTESEFNYPFPMFVNNLTNSTAHAPSINDTVGIRIDVNDNQEINSFKVANNLTGILQNVTTIDLSSTQETNFTYLYNLTTNLSRFNRIAVKFWADDSGGWQNETETYLIDVKNALPSISVSLEPSPIQAGQDAVCNPSITDKDGDSNWQNNITIWLKNGIENLSSQVYNKSVLRFGNFTSNDKIQCKFSVFDGFEWSLNSTSQNVTVGDTTAPTISNIEVSGVSFDVTQNVKINATVIDASSSFEFVKVTVNNTNFTMSATGGNTFAYNNLFAIGNYNVTAMHAKDSSGNIFSNTSIGIQFTVSASGGTTIIVNAAGGGGDEPKKGNTTFDLQTDSFGQEYYSVSVKSKSIQEIVVLIQNNGNKTVNIKLKCTEALNGFCEGVQFDKETYQLPPSNFPVEAKVKVKIPAAQLFSTFSMVIEGTSSEGGLDDLRVSMIVFPRATDVFKIVGHSIFGIVKFGGEDGFPIPIFLIFASTEIITLLILVPRDFKFKIATIIGLSLLLFIISGLTGFQLCRIGTCSSII